METHIDVVVNPNGMRAAEEELRRLRSRYTPPPIVIYLDGSHSNIRSMDRLRSVGLTRLEALTMVNMRMTGLGNVPRMPRLESLDLSDNRITGNLQRLLSCQRLINLNLSRNRIKTIDSLEPLKSLKCLQSLDLFGNDVIFVVNYRQKVFNLIKTLRYLDGSLKETDE